MLDASSTVGPAISGEPLLNVLNLQADERLLLVGGAEVGRIARQLNPEVCCRVVTDRGQEPVHRGQCDDLGHDFLLDELQDSTLSYLAESFDHVLVVGEDRFLGRTMLCEYNRVLADRGRLALILSPSRADDLLELRSRLEEAGFTVDGSEDEASIDDRRPVLKATKARRYSYHQGA